MFGVKRWLYSTPKLFIRTFTSRQDNIKVFALIYSQALKTRASDPLIPTDRYRWSLLLHRNITDRNLIVDNRPTRSRDLMVDSRPRSSNFPLPPNFDDPTRVLAPHASRNWFSHLGNVLHLSNFLLVKLNCRKIGLDFELRTWNLRICAQLTFDQSIVSESFEKISAQCAFCSLLPRLTSCDKISEDSQKSYLFVRRC